MTSSTRDITLAPMAFSFWQIFGAKILFGSAIAFALAWCIRSKSSAYQYGLIGSLLVVLVPSCVPMYQSDPPAANRAAEEFFWIMVPLLGAWLVGAFIGMRFARVVRWKE